MYSDVADEGTGGADLSFDEAFARLKPVYEALYADYLRRHGDELPADYRRIAQIQILGPGAGFFYLEFGKNGVDVVPCTYHDADVFLAASFDNLVGMTDGTVSADRLFMNGQLRVLGNIAKGAELRHMLRPISKRKKTRR